MNFDNHILTRPIMPIHLPSVFINMCLSRGYQIEHLLKNTGLELQDFSNLQNKLNLQQIEIMINNAFMISNDVTLSIAYSQYIRLSHLGSLGIAILNAPTLKHIISTIIKYSCLIDPAIFLDNRIIKNNLHLFFGEKFFSTKNHPYSHEALCLSIIKLLELVIEDKLPQLKIYMNTPKPFYADKFKFLNSPIYWECPQSKIVFNVHILDKPLPGANSLAFLKAIDACEYEYNLQLKNDDAWLLKLKSIILKNIQNTLTAEKISNSLNLSRRTFFRKLEKYNLSYEQLIASTKSELAIKNLINEKGEIKKVADYLGYSDISSFSKAFKRWYGITPKQWYIKYQSGEYLI
ncbi:AraC family transcriptional regulator [Acinetobacter puyangensis]|uniref:AraC-type DNA-binding protein n=1 Tax=Acinetobacter puyangensis TaxID=1096779 RepID=A0A240ECP7_9GAMM|nr:AraC family transcriptional regulator [Acinetobacter puyangensis]SNX46474.1 AraC-type DNA-binding protein [Acinetobacter puyangensis]